MKLQIETQYDASTMARFGTDAQGNTLDASVEANREAGIAQGTPEQSKKKKRKRKKRTNSKRKYRNTRQRLSNCRTWSDRHQFTDQGIRNRGHDMYLQRLHSRHHIESQKSPLKLKVDTILKRNVGKVDQYQFKVSQTRKQS